MSDMQNHYFRFPRVFSLLHCCTSCRDQRLPSECPNPGILNPDVSPKGSMCTQGDGSPRVRAGRARSQPGRIFVS